ncbi:MmgE/PrpD family protein [Rhodococcus koreensis]
MTLLDDIVSHARAAAAAPHENLRPLLGHVLAAGLGPDLDEVLDVDTAFGTGIPGRAALRTSVVYGRGQDDFYMRGRVHIVPIVLSGTLITDSDDILPALAAGASAQMQVSAAYGGPAQLRGLRATALFGSVGAAVAAGVALGLDDRQLAHALAIGLTRSSATTQSIAEGDAEEWRIDALIAVDSGVRAALFAQAGWRASAHALEGVSGWGKAMFGDPEASILREVVDTWSDSPADITVKPFPATGMATPAFVFVDEIARELDRAMPDSIRIASHPDIIRAVGSDGRSPFTSRSGLAMSIARCAAEVYATGTVGNALVPGVSAGGLDILEAENRVELVPDERLPVEEFDVLVRVGGTERRSRGRALHELQPTWDRLAGSVDVVAQRNNVEPALVAQLFHDLDAAQIPAATVSGYLDARHAARTVSPHL